jgi:hypothetical protein
MDKTVRSPSTSRHADGQSCSAEVAHDAVEELLAIRPAAIAEATRLCPELLSAELVDLGDGTWLDVLRWSVADGEERLMAQADEFDALLAMHGLLSDAEQLGRGRVIASPS